MADLMKVIEYAHINGKNVAKTSTYTYLDTEPEGPHSVYL